VAYVLQSWPRLTKAFIVNEIVELERIGVSISIFALERSGESLVQSQVGDVQATVRYVQVPFPRCLPAHLRRFLHSPRRYLATFLYSRQRRLYGGYSELGPVKAFSAAVCMADELARQNRATRFTGIHAHFAHDPALVGALVHRLSGVGFSFTAHARDVYQISDSALLARAREARAVVTCCQANVEHIRATVPASTRVELIYHGVDLAHFAPSSTGSSDGELLILSVGRLVEKKGFDDLLEACAVLAGNGRRFRCQVFGDGPDRGRLESLRNRLGLKQTVEFAGTRTHAELIPALQRADIFALTPHVTADSDREGIPNVLLEAMACALPVVLTPVGGIAEVVRDGSNGLLIESGSTAAIAAGLATLLDDAGMRVRLGGNAARTAAAFDARNAATRLAELFVD